MSLRVLLLLACLGVLGACGSVKLEAGDVQGAGSQDAGTSDADTAGDDTPDLGSVDSGGTDLPGNECTTPFDCLGAIKASACIVPSCVNGYCKKEQKAAGTTCIDPKQKPAECQQTTCTATGQCALSDQAEGSACGGVLCGKKCSTGQCVAATEVDYEDGNPCTKDFCDQGIQVRHQPITDLGKTCDDGDTCTASDTCVGGACKGQAVDCSDGVACTFDTCSKGSGCAHTPDAKQCDDGNPCTIQACDASKGCQITGFDDKPSCNDGDDCTASDHCTSSGACLGSATCACKVDADCKATNLCLGVPKCQEGLCKADPAAAVTCDGSLDTTCSKNACDPATGQCKPTPQKEDQACDDGNACTAGSVCVVGACQGPADVDCNDKNPCTNDQCVPSLGCVHQGNEEKCDDGNPCTLQDGCVSGGCVGVATGCDDGVACTFDTCDQGTGQCKHTAGDKACDDKNPCTTDGCDAKLGCIHQPDSSGTCDDGDSCTQDACKSGQCISTYVCQCQDDAGCNDNNPCTADKCTAGKCSNDVAPLDGKACDSGDKCQQPGSGLCGGGACKTGNKPIDCSTVANACNAGQCNPATGGCIAVPKADASPCDSDGNGCTQGDACQGGKCSPGVAVDCGAKGDACNNAACQSTGPAAYTCNITPKVKGTSCDDGQYCTQSDTCDGAGKCLGGLAKTCGEVADACNSGQCDEAKDQCAKVAKASTISCDDGQFCTSGDHCDGAGKCTGGGVLVCPGGNCLVGKCDEAVDKCAQVAAAAGTSCTDGNACTATDSCDAAGKCLGSTAIACKGDACNDAACNPTSGKCDFKPKASTVTCDDAAACTVGDHCDGAGKCLGGPWDNACGCQTDTACNDGNSCTLDKCDKTTSKCVFTVQAGIACDDKNACTTASACTSAGACVGTANYDCSASADGCNSGACTDGSGAPQCKKVPLAAGTACSDGLFCTTADACDGGGKCAGGPAPLCGKTAMCNSSFCTEAAKGCTAQPVGKGTSCNDGDPCTAGETCDGAGSCAKGGAVPEFSTCDDFSDKTTGDVCVAGKCLGFAMDPGPPGITSDVTFDAQAKHYVALASDAPLASYDAAGGWHLWSVDGVPGAGLKIGALTPAQTTPWKAIDGRLAVGLGGQVLYSPGADKWVAQAPLNTALAKLSLPTTTDYFTVAFRTVGASECAVFGGHIPAGGTVPEAMFFVNCTMSVGATTATCARFNLPVTSQPVASVINTNTKPFCTTCAPNPTTWLDAASLNSVSQNTGFTLFSAPPLGTSLAATAGPVLSPASSLRQGGVLVYDTSLLLTGMSLTWQVGPSGHVSYQKAGTTGTFSAELTTAVQANYNFTAVTNWNGTVLVWGDRPDAKVAGSRVPVLFTHHDDLNQQSGAAYWTEHDLTPPLGPGVYCNSNGLRTSGMAVAASGAVLTFNYCGNTAPSKGTFLRGWLLSRPLQ